MQPVESHTRIEPETLKALEQAILLPDMKTGKRLVEELSSRHGYDTLIFDVFEPLLTEIGERLKRNEASLAQSYVASILFDDVLKRFESADIPAGREGHPRLGPVVMANIEDDCHPLGRKIVSTLLRVNNWEVCDLGIDVEAGKIVDKAVEIGARVIGLSAMIFTTAENIRKVREEIDARGLAGRVKLAVGGAVFRLRPDLYEKVGADGTAPSAFTAAALFADLWRKAEGSG
ncbi:MAG: cobalamin-dependent protein [Candidatus Aminicenantes bacterium]|nr:cobalamin-dependent protein [Candidatus Aminicenantes bacterium]